jgi:hypothetical protein
MLIGSFVPGSTSASQARYCATSCRTLSGWLSSCQVITSGSVPAAFACSRKPLTWLYSTLVLGPAIRASGILPLIRW